MASIAQVRECIELQNTMNNIVNPQWKTAMYRWDRAALVEAVECMDHIGWKWWKKQDINREQAFIELVDIFHFLLSYYLIRGRITPELVINAYEHANKKIHRNKDKEYVLTQLETFIECVVEKDIPIDRFFNVLVSLNYTLDDLVKYYIGKNVLNQFRQANGYKEGTYIKNWSTPEELASGVDIEDNVILEEILQKTPIISFALIKQELSDYYHQVQNKFVSVTAVK